MEYFVFEECDLKVVDMKLVKYDDDSIFVIVNDLEHKFLIEYPTIEIATSIYNFLVDSFTDHGLNCNPENVINDTRSIYPWTFCLKKQFGLNMRRKFMRLLS
jgi:hypothetical protein